MSNKDRTRSGVAKASKCSLNPSAQPPRKPCLPQQETRSSSGSLCKQDVAGRFSRYLVKITMSPPLRMSMATTSEIRMLLSFKKSVRVMQLRTVQLFRKL